jgi:hypothetical protein
MRIKPCLVLLDVNEIYGYMKKVVLSWDIHTCDMCYKICKEI